MTSDTYKTLHKGQLEKTSDEIECLLFHSLRYSGPNRLCVSRKSSHSAESMKEGRPVLSSGSPTILVIVLFSLFKDHVE